MNLNCKIISCSLVDLLKLGYINPLSTDIYSAKNTAEGEVPFFILIVVLRGRGLSPFFILIVLWYKGEGGGVSSLSLLGYQCKGGGVPHISLLWFQCKGGGVPHISLLWYQCKRGWSLLHPFCGILEGVVPSISFLCY